MESTPINTIILKIQYSKTGKTARNNDCNDTTFNKVSFDDEVSVLKYLYLLYFFGFDGACSRMNDFCYSVMLWDDDEEFFTHPQIMLLMKKKVTTTTAMI